MGFPVVSVVKNPPVMQKTWVWSLGQEDPLEKDIEIHSSTLPCISSLETQTVKRLPTMREIQAWIFFFKPHFDLSVVILCMPLPITALGVTQFIYIWT